MIGCDEQPGKGIELQGTGYLSGKSVPSWFPPLGVPPRLETSLLNIAPGSLASHSPPLSQTLEPVDSPQPHVCCSPSISQPC